MSVNKNILKEVYNPDDLLGLEFEALQDKVPFYSRPSIKANAIKGFFKKGEKTGKIRAYKLAEGFRSVYMYLTDKGIYIYPKADWFNLTEKAQSKGIKSIYEKREEEKQKEIEEEKKGFFDRLTDKILPLAFILIGGKILLSSTQNKKQ